MKKEVNIIAHTKNHIFRLAEMLSEAGVLKKIYTIYPLFKLKEYNLSKKNIFSFRFFAAFIYICNYFKIFYKKILFSDLFDFFVAKKITKEPEKKQYIIGLSGYCLKTITKAKKKEFTTIVERACPHILFQKKIITEEINNLPITDKLELSNSMFDEKIIDKMISEYDACDFICVPSNYSGDTFKQYKLNDKVVYSPLIPGKKIFNKNSLYKNDFIILSVGFNFLRKGFYYLIKAMEEIQNIKDIKLKIRSNIPKGLNIKIPGNVEIITQHISNTELEKLYNEASIVALPSIDEGFGLTAVEAISIGKPIIITENVGMSDIIKKYSPDLNNHILKIRDIDAIKELILSLYDNKKYMNEIGSKFQLAFKKYIDSDEPYSFYKKHLQLENDKKNNL